MMRTERQKAGERQEERQPQQSEDREGNRPDIAQGEPQVEDERYIAEQKRLNETIEEIEKQLDAIGGRYYGDDFTEQVLDVKRQENRQRLEILLREPYFGRLDYQEAGTEAPKPLYIGKRGMERSGTSEPYIIDWRAPIASLFYTFTGGDEPVAYEAPDGEMFGEIHLKRNISVRDGKLDRVVDSYVRGGDNLGLNDEFLLYRLGERKDNRLRDIVSTIQAEQDRIIRAPRELALIIQGAAGSGKTTVALHRLAYLMYQYHDRLRSERMIIFAPNALFLDYISGVLPELGAGDIQQTTFADWVIDLLDREVRLYPENNSTHFSLHGEPGDTMTAGRIKGSLAYKDHIERAMQSFEQKLVPDSPFEAWEDTRLEAAELRQWFETFAPYPLAQRRERLIARMNRWLEMRLAEIKDPSIRKQRSKTAKQKLRTYVKKLPEVSVTGFYRSWLETEGAASGLDPASVRRTIEALKEGMAYQEDLPALVWIHTYLHGIRGHRFDHVVIDEAQDASPFQIDVLRSYMREPSFTILGDLAQGIHWYRGISNWQELEEVFAQEELSYHELRQSYRSTYEIIEFANKILTHTDTGLPPAMPVFRSGEEVELQKLEDSDDESLITAISSYIEEQKAAGMHTIAIIGRTSEACATIYAQLLETGLTVELLEEDQTRYSGGVLIVPIYLAKGLEFDAVLIIDADSRTYRLDSLDAKLLYVGCTRALHRLKLLHRGEPTPLIS